VTTRTYAWSKRSEAPTAAALQQPLDSQHLNPTADLRFPDGQLPEWAASVYAPILPADYTGEAFATPVAVGGGPIDYTPLDHADGGGGVGHAQSTLEAQDQRGFWHSEDDGAVAARAWESFSEYPLDMNIGHAFLQPNAGGHGDSPSTLQLQRTGVDQPNDPYARSGERWLKRWVDFKIDMHRWAVELRPLISKNAFTARLVPPSPVGGQYTSPFEANGPFEATPDRFVVPQDRRVPVPWDQTMTIDGVAPVADFNLGTWGL
jgi:hypothetical protein